MSEQTADTLFAVFLAKVAPYAPALAGALISFSFVVRLTVRQVMIAVSTGLASALFLAPAIIELADLIWPGDIPDSVGRGIVFLVGAFAAVLLPILLEVLKRALSAIDLQRALRIGPASGAHQQAEVRHDDVA